MLDVIFEFLLYVHFIVFKRVLIDRFISKFEIKLLLWALSIALNKLKSQFLVHVFLKRHSWGVFQEGHLHVGKCLIKVINIVSARDVWEEGRSLISLSYKACLIFLSLVWFIEVNFLDINSLWIVLFLYHKINFLAWSEFSLALRLRSLFLLVLDRGDAFL